MPSSTRSRHRSVGIATARAATQRSQPPASSLSLEVKDFNGHSPLSTGRNAIRFFNKISSWRLMVSGVPELAVPKLRIEIVESWTTSH